MIAIYRLAVRLLLPVVADRLGGEMAATAARLAADARARGTRAWLRYWLAEFHALGRVAWHERPPERGRMFSNLLQDVRSGVRLLGRTPGITAIALITLALGIGANTALFSIVDGVLLRPLAYPQADRLFLIQHTNLKDGSLFGSTTPANFYDIRREATLMQPIAAFSTDTVTLTGRGDPERLQGVGSVGSILEVLGVAPQLGRIFTAEDDRLDAPNVVVISDNLWRRLFDGRTDALGRTLVLGGDTYTVIGVMPRGFTFPDTKMDFWVPAHLRADLRASRVEYFLTIVGRLREGATPAAARAELDAIMARLRDAHPQENGALALDAQPLRDSFVDGISRLLWILMGSVAFVLLIACANLANLLLARATGRTREIAIRQAIGAGRARVLRQLLIESLLLALAGGAAGIVTAQVFLGTLVAWLPAGIPRIEQASIDGRVLLFTFAATMAAGVFFGFAPAWQLSRRNPTAALREDARAGSTRSRLRSLLVTAEVAIAVVLLAGAGLLVRSFVLIQRVDPGFATDRLLTFRVGMEGAAYREPRARIAFVQRAVDRLKTLPSVTAAAAGSNAPITGRGTGAWFNILARPTPPGTTPPSVPYRVVTAEYFKTMGIPLVRGRLLRESDGRDGTPSVVISESVARRFWRSPAEGDPIGADIYLGAPDYRLFPSARIVGIVKDVKLAGLGTPLTDAVYGLHSLMPFWSGFTFDVRTSGDPAALASSVRAVIRDLDPSLAVTRIESMHDIVRESLAPARASMLLLMLFAAIALVMAAVGVFGVMSYAVLLRSREMGIRLALGARPASVRRMILANGLAQAGTGTAIGLALAAWLTRLMETLLFGVSPGDPLTFASVAAILLAVAALACYLPARRATTVDPLIVLRTE
jgi:putative ABC transport system permease protein